MNGLDWANLTGPVGDDRINECGILIGGSPVNLLKPIGSYGYAYGDIVPFAEDSVKKTYTNLWVP